MNLAARLMEASSTGLLAAVRLSSHYGRRFRLTSAGTFALRGVREPVAAVRVEDQADGVVPPELFGRRKATEQLDQIIRRARDGSGGRGAYRLTWSAGHAAAMGVRCVIGQCDLTEAASTYFALRPILRALVGGSPSDSV
jgi:hypothetical protein